MQKTKLLTIITNTIDEHKGQNVTVVDVQNKTSITDFMVLATATGGRHAKALANHIITSVKSCDATVLGVEGSGSDWVLLDLDCVVVHIFTAQARDFYQLEKLWTVDRKIA